MIGAIKSNNIYFEKNTKYGNSIQRKVPISDNVNFAARIKPQQSLETVGDFLKHDIFKQIRWKKHFWDVRQLTAVGKLPGLKGKILAGIKSEGGVKPVSSDVVRFFVKLPGQKKAIYSEVLGSDISRLAVKADIKAGSKKRLKSLRDALIQAFSGFEHQGNGQFKVPENSKNLSLICISKSISKFPTWKEEGKEFKATHPLFGELSLIPAPDGSPTQLIVHNTHTTGKPYKFETVIDGLEDSANKFRLENFVGDLKDGFISNVKKFNWAENVPPKIKEIPYDSDVSVEIRRKLSSIIPREDHEVCSYVKPTEDTENLIDSGVKNICEDNDTYKYVKELNKEEAEEAFLDINYMSKEETYYHLFNIYRSLYKKTQSNVDFMENRYRQINPKYDEFLYRLNNDIFSAKHPGGEIKICFSKEYNVAEIKLGNKSLYMPQKIKNDVYSVIKEQIAERQKTDKIGINSILNEIEGVQKSD